MVAAIPTHEVAKAGASRVAAVAARPERTLLRVAPQASLSDHDAHDANHRTLEIFLRGFVIAFVFLVVGVFAAVA